MYPIMINLKHKKVVVVGGGNVASRKIATLLQEEADVHVISPTLHDKINPEAVTWVKKCYETGDLDGALLVFACTDDQAVNTQIMAEAHESQMVNNTGDKTNSKFYNVAMIKHDDFSVNISTNGVSPARSKEIRQKLETILPSI